MNLKSAAHSLSLLRIGYGVGSKIKLLIALIRLKLGREKPFTCSLTIDGKRSVYTYLSGSRDEFTILRDLFIGEEYKALDTIDVKHILDLGANIGLASAWFRLKYPNALIHAYEPAPRAFTLLRKNAEQIGNIKIFDEAIGAQKGIIEFKESSRSVASSLLFEGPNVQKIKVPVCTIDDAIERIDVVDLLKIDIEGAEFEALSAATKLFRVTYITGEAHPKLVNRSLKDIYSVLAREHDVTIIGTDESRLAGFYGTIKK